MLVVLTGSNRNSKFDLVANARGSIIGSARSHWLIVGERQQLHIILWCRTPAPPWVASFRQILFFRKVLPKSGGGVVFRACGVVAVDHHAIKAWRAIVRKAEQFIPELLWSPESGRDDFKPPARPFGPA
jgi:hypothetical protein